MSDRCQVIASHGASCIREAGHDGPHSTVVGSRWHESEIESLRQQLRGAVALLDDLADVLADVSAGVVPADGSVVRDVLKRAARHANGGSR